MEITPKIMAETGVTPTSIEYMDRFTVEATCRYLNERLPYQDAEAMLLIEVDGGSEEQAVSDAWKIGELCYSSGAIEVYVADNATTKERVWAVRRNMDEALRALAPVQTDEDTVVPISAIHEFTLELENIAKRRGILIPNFGHAGDGNLHPTLLKPDGMSMDDWLETEERARRDIYELCKRLGGKITGEHGIGCRRLEFLNIFASDAEIAMMRAIKDALDPNGIMNPGKIFR